jgi:hypothetical protein
VNPGEIWGTEGGGGEIVDRLQAKFCKKMLRIPRNEAEGMAESLRKDSKCCNQILGYGPADYEAGTSEIAV